MWFVVNVFFLYLVFGVICKLWHELNYAIKVVLDETMNSSVLMMRFDKIMEKVKNKISKKDIFLFMKSMEQMEMDYDFVSFFFKQTKEEKYEKSC